MNFLEAEVVGESMSGVRGEGFSFPLPQHLSAAVSNRGIRKVLVGLRPEHFSVQGAGGTTSSVFAPIELEVTVAEYIGSSQFLAARVAGVPVTASVEVGPDSSPLESGQYLFDTSRIHLFEKETGDAIT